MRPCLYPRSHSTITIVATFAICVSYRDLKRSFRFYRYAFCHYLRCINWRLIFSARSNNAGILSPRTFENPCRFVPGATCIYLIIGEVYPLCSTYTRTLCPEFFKFINMICGSLVLSTVVRYLPSILSLVLFT